MNQHSDPTPALRSPEAFPEVWDSTMLSQLKSCHRRFHLESMWDWKRKGQSVHLHAGAAFAHGLEHARKAFFELGRPPAEALAMGVQALLQFYGNFQAPEDSPKTAERMAGALIYYFDSWPLGDCGADPHILHGKRMIEFNFACEIKDVLHPVTGDPLLFCGRADMVVDYAGGIFLEDDKTTSQLGASWPYQWNLRSQFSGYQWGLRQFGIEAQGTLVRGVAIRKTGYDHMQTPTYRPQWMVDEWYYETCHQLHRAIAAWRSDYWGPAHDHACNEYGGCTFRSICTIPADRRRSFLELDFERRHWDPLAREEIPVT